MEVSRGRSRTILMLNCYKQHHMWDIYRWRQIKQTYSFVKETYKIIGTQENKVEKFSWVHPQLNHITPRRVNNQELQRRPCCHHSDQSWKPYNPSHRCCTFLLSYQTEGLVCSCEVSTNFYYK